MDNFDNKKIKIGKKESLVENLLIVEGVTRSGKYLLANLLYSFRGIEPVQSSEVLDNIHFLERFGLIDKAVVQEILQYEVDTRCYDMLIGRNLNHRASDKSSIYNIPNYKEYLRRCEDEDGDSAVRKFYKNNLYSLFVVHELMPNIKIFFDTFPNLKVISVQRSPVDLVYSWYNRGYGKRFNDDPRLFSWLFQEKGKNIPMFAAEWGQKYLRLSEMDRCLAAIEWIIEASAESYSKLDPRDKRKILFINYEKMLLNTENIIEKIGIFIKRPIVRDNIKSIFKREKLPNLHYSELKSEKLDLIKKMSSPNYFKKLIILEDNYLKNNGELQ